MWGALKQVAEHRGQIKAVLIGSDSSLLNHGGTVLGQVSFTRVSGANDAIRLLGNEPFDVVLVDADDRSQKYEEVISHLTAWRKDLVCAVVTEVGSEEMWVEVLNAGACDLLEKRDLGPSLISLLRRYRRPAAA